MAITKLPRKVRYELRQNKGNHFFLGEVIQEVSVDEINTIQNGDYRHVMQLIQREDDTYDIRMGYYVKNNDASDSEYRWGSQTTFHAPVEIFMKLLDKAKQEKLI